MTGALSMIQLDQTVVTVALPSMSHDLPLTAGGQQWVVNAYVLAMAALVALGGKLGDRFGGVTTFRIGVVLFFVASLACGFAPPGDLGQAWIIAARALQGAGGALMMPVSAAIVMGAFEVRERGRAMAIYAGVSQVFLAVGPLLGGLLTETVSWRTVFWLNVPVGIAALIMVRVARPENVCRPGTSIRGTSVALLIVGVASAVLAIQQSSDWGWTSPATLVLLVVGVGLSTWFVVGQLRASDPLVQLRLFANRAFLGNVIVLGLVQFGLLPVVLYSSLYLQDLLHLSPLMAGLGALPLIASLAIAAQLGGRWYDRSGVRPPVLAGLAISVVGLAGWAVSLASIGYPLQLPGMILTGFGLGMLMSPTNTDALSRAGVAERGQASGLVLTIRQLGGTIGVAAIGAVILGIEHAGTHASSPQHAADAITIGFAVAAATFAVALVAGWILLSRDRILTDEKPSGTEDVAALAT